MCGITGFIDLKRAAAQEKLMGEVGSMTDALTHRGPDMGDQWVDPEAGVALGFRRLAIIDLTPTGHQPMTSADGRFVVVYNGEAYNFADLRVELEAAGRKFRGTSDTEVFLEGCVAWGVEATVGRLLGMFAFALWDRREKRLWLGRDRIGIKPLYYGQFDNLFLFGSELKALRAKDGWQPEIDRDSLAAYFRFNYVPAPNTIYRNIYKLEPGTLLSLRLGEKPKLKQYWNLANVASQGRLVIDEEEAYIECETLLRDAVKRRLVADVPLGVLLSGGVDSSAVTALMQSESGHPVKSFTVGFENAGFNEAGHAKAIAQHIGTEHHEVYLSDARALELVPNLPDWYDEPFGDSSALPTWLVAQMAREHVTVALSGDGGDEVFFGYNRYHAAAATWSNVKHFPKPMRTMAAAAISSIPTAGWDAAVQILPQSIRPSLAGDKAHKLSSILSESDADGMYRRLVSHWSAPEQLVANGREPINADWNDARSISDFSERMAFLDTKTYLPDDILTKVDRASMAVSLEVRVPLLDHRVVEFAWRLPKEMKLKGASTKRLLRRILYRHVPRELVDRPKAGFAVPLDQWLRGPLRNWAEALLDEKRLTREGVLNPSPIRHAWTNHLAGRGNEGQAIWGVLMFQSWRERWNV
jgi:asparagine synthase (glutamine-hydrolysing)